MRLVCHLRRIRGDRTLAKVLDAIPADQRRGLTRGSLSDLETGRRLPRDEWIPLLEPAYGAPVTD